MRVCDLRVSYVCDMYVCKSVCTCVPDVYLCAHVMYVFDVYMRGWHVCACKYMLSVLLVDMCAYIYACAWWVCVCICVYVYVCVCVLFVSMCVCVWKYVRGECARMSKVYWIRARAYICVCMWMYIYAWVYVHVQVKILIHVYV